MLLCPLLVTQFQVCSKNIEVHRAGESPLSVREPQVIRYNFNKKFIMKLKIVWIIFCSFIHYFSLFHKIWLRNKSCRLVIKQHRIYIIFAFRRTYSHDSNVIRLYLLVKQGTRRYNIDLRSRTGKYVRRYMFGTLKLCLGLYTVGQKGSYMPNIYSIIMLRT